jgi:hypothetical protein
MENHAMSVSTARPLLVEHAAKDRSGPSCLAASAAGFDLSVDAAESLHGWATWEAAAGHVAAHEALTVHDAWRGPTKLRHTPGGLRQRVEIALPQRESAAGQSLFDEAESQEREAQRQNVVAAAQQMLAAPADAPLQNHIAAAALRAWTEADGHAVATDEQGNLRLALAYGSFAGQMRIECQPQRLRLVMALGCWTNLPAAVEAAMLCLAAEWNARIRLVRLAWLGEGPTRRGEGQVDLTGVPWVEEGHPYFEATARGMLRLGLAGLALTARYVGRELNILADPANRDLADTLNELAAGRPGWDPVGPRD